MIRPALRLNDERDEVLAGLAATGSGAAFAVLVTRHRGAVCAIALNMSATLRDAERVLQQTFLVAWQEMRAFSAEMSFATFLYRIAIRTALAQRPRERERSSAVLEALQPAFDGEGRLQASREGWRMWTARGRWSFRGSCPRP